MLSADRVEHSIIGIRAVVREGSVVRDSVIMGADYYDKEDRASGEPKVGIGRGCVIERAIIDKNVQIGDGVRISPEGKADGTVTDRYTVRDGVIVIAKNSVIASGEVL